MSFPGELASTTTGKAWVIKALHPSDPTPSCSGIPDSSSCPNVVLSYYNVYRISAPVGATSWGFDLTALPNILLSASVSIYNNLDVLTSSVNFQNSSFFPVGSSTAPYAQQLISWEALGIEAHRLVGMGITAYQDGPSLSDQGTLTAAQWAVARNKLVFSNMAPAIDQPYCWSSTRCVKYQNGDLANYATSQHMPNAYFGPSKDGCYLPMRLDESCMKWTTSADLERICGESFSPYNHNVPIPVTSFTTTPMPVPPFPSVVPVFYSNDVGHINFGQIMGDQVYRPLNGIWGGISCRNLSPATSFAFYVRQTIECRVLPSSMLAPQQGMSPPYDPVALATYFRISRELKDAYPADYNDMGKLWEVIKKAMKVASPVLLGMGGPVGILGAGLTSAIGAIDSFRRAGGNPKRSGKAQVAKAQASLQQATSVVKQAAKALKGQQAGGARRRKKGVKTD